MLLPDFDQLRRIQDVKDRLCVFGHPRQLVRFEQLQHVVRGVGPQQKQAIRAEPHACLVTVGHPSGMPDQETSHGVDQVARKVRAQLRCALSIRA